MKSIDGLKVKDSPQKKSVPKKTINKVNKKNNKLVTAAKKKENIKKTEDIQSPELFLKPVESFDYEFSSNDIKTKKKCIKKEKKKLKATKIVLFIFLLIIILGLVGLFIWGDKIISNITGGESNIFDIVDVVTQETFTDLKTDDNGRTNILAFGTSGYNMSGSEGNGIHDGAQLTDSIMVISLDQASGDVAMINLPRDLKVSSTCTATGKINELYWCANQNGQKEVEGANAMMNEISKILNIDFQYYVHVNWGSLVTIVDTLGGITVTLDENINDKYYTGTVITAGVPTTLNGEEALGLARARHGTTLGDFSRGNSQQKILIALKDKIASEQLSLAQALNIIQTLGDNLRTNISLDEIKTGVHLLGSLDLTSMRQVTLIDWTKDIHYMTTATINGISYVIPQTGAGNYSQIQKYIAKSLSNNPIEREDATILVLNGTEEPGIAGHEQKKLEASNITVKTIDNAPAGEYEDIEIYDLSGSKYGTKKLIEDFYGLQSKSKDNLPTGISTQYDFVIIIGKGTLEE